MPEALLALEDGSVFHGTSFGAAGETVFELVFNTSLTGYEEILTDPSYRGQGVVFTNPHIGNTGINGEDGESARPQISAVITRALSPVVSSWRARQPLADWLKEYGVAGIDGIDTRRLTKTLRESGTMKAALSSVNGDEARLVALAQAWQGLDGQDTVRQVSCQEPYAWVPDEGQKRWVGLREPSWHVVAYDLGVKRNIIRLLSAHGARVTVVPAWTPAQEALALQPDGIFLANGPGDPAGIPYVAAITAELLESGLPIFGICLGHQLLGMALGGRTEKLKFGHHGGNHPVRDYATNRVLITAQNHNYALVPGSLPPQAAQITHLSLNDGSIEGLRAIGKPVFSVQFHPESMPGPHDAHGLFANFFELMARRRNA